MIPTVPSTWLSLKLKLAVDMINKPLEQAAVPTTVAFAIATTL
jgi:hypothetical protein